METIYPSQCHQIYKDFHQTKSPREKDAMPLHSMTVEQPSKSGKLNGVGNIFLVLFDLHKYTYHYYSLYG
jgi:hypothetical protein